MAPWVNRTVASGASVAANGTTSHTVAYTTPTLGNKLYAVCDGGVTFTTPSGWTLIGSAVNNTGLYAFSKTAVSGDVATPSFVTTHNASNYAIQVVIYEFPAGSAGVGTPGSAINTAVGSAVNGPACTSLTGTYSRWDVRAQIATAASTAASTAWTLPTTEDFDVLVLHSTNDGCYMTIAYDEGATGTSFTPNANTSSILGTPCEDLSFAITIAAAAASMPEFVQPPRIPY